MTRTPDRENLLASFGPRVKRWTDRKANGRGYAQCCDWKTHPHGDCRSETAKSPRLTKAQAAKSLGSSRRKAW